MSDTDSFIDEVSEEVRRDRLFGLMRRYGWIAILGVILIVGGAAWIEWTKAQDRASAQAFGDAMLTALEGEDRTTRTDALSQIQAPSAASRAILDLLAAGEESGPAPKEAAQRLLALADREGVDLIYRQIAILKAVTIPNSDVPLDERREHLEGLALGGGMIRLLAEDQLALIDVETGDTEAAIERLQQVANDAGATLGLRRRVTQVMVALGSDWPNGQQAE